MKEFLILILLVTFAANNSFGSPLIFKVTKEINAKDLIELGSFDATKYRQIRISIKVIYTSNELSTIKDTPAYSQLIVKRAELKAKLDNLKLTLKEQHPEVIATQNNIDKINDEIAKLAAVEVDLTSTVSILGVDIKDEILLSSFTERNLNRSIVIDSPPSKISVKVLGKGTYTLYVWGQ